MKKYKVKVEVETQHYNVKEYDLLIITNEPEYLEYIAYGRAYELINGFALKNKLVRMTILKQEEIRS